MPSFPKHTQKNNNNKCCIIDLLFWFFLFKLKKRDTRFLSESRRHIYFRSTKYHKGRQEVNKPEKLFTERKILDTFRSLSYLYTKLTCRLYFESYWVLFY